MTENDKEIIEGAGFKYFIYSLVVSYLNTMYLDHIHSLLPPPPLLFIILRVQLVLPKGTGPSMGE